MLHQERDSSALPSDEINGDLDAGGRSGSTGRNDRKLGESRVVSKSNNDCKCSILSAREERLLDDEGRVEIRLVCNRCGAVLDREVVPTARKSRHAAAGASVSGESNAS